MWHGVLPYVQRGPAFGPVFFEGESLFVESSNDELDAEMRVGPGVAQHQELLFAGGHVQPVQGRLVALQWELGLHFDRWREHWRSVVKQTFFQHGATADIIVDGLQHFDGG